MKDAQATNPEQEFVPEVDPQSLSHLQLAEASPTLPDTADESPPTDPQQMLETLPDTLATHIREMIAQADAQGYLRGRNEAIEARLHYDDRPDDDHTVHAATFPNYCRRSLWDCG